MLINRDATAYDSDADLIIRDRVGEVLGALTVSEEDAQHEH